MIIILLLATFKFLFIFFPQVVLHAAREGLMLWFHNVMPGLLPFIIITNLLLAFGVVKYVGGILEPFMKRIFGLPGAGGFAFVVGLTSGYPIGAKTVAQLRKDGNISAPAAQHLAAFCNNAGPLFILGVVGVGFFGSTSVGYLLWGGHVLGALLLGVLLRPFYAKVKSATPSPHNAKPQPIWAKVSKMPLQNSEAVSRHIKKPPPGKALGDSTKNAMESITIIGGLIIFFNTIVAVLGEIGLPDEGLVSGIITGLIEVTGGVSKISQGGANTLHIALAAFIIAFGGASIHMQTLHFFEGSGIKPGIYIAHKCLHGILAAIITMGLSTVIPL